jgi:membrane protein DedA with SNARE-associated domain/membrane-associated phospholipid phosphatase
MESWLQHLFGWLPGGWVYYTLIGFVALLESIVGIGIFVPGSVLVLFAGFLSIHGKGNLAVIMVCAALGALLGDLLSYWLGARLGTNLLQTGPFRKRRELVNKAEIFFASHGGKSLFFGRFVGPMRGFIPFVAGGAQMRPLAFITYTLVSGILWGLAYPGLGYLGGASWQRVQILTGRLSLLIASLLVLFILNSLFWKKLAPRLARWCASLWSLICSAWRSFLHTPQITAFALRHPLLWTFLADRFSVRRGSGLYLTVGLATSALFSVVFVWVVEASLRGPFLQIDQRVYQLVQLLRHPVADTFWLIVTCLGSGPVILILAGLTLLWLVLNNRDFSAIILVTGTAGGEILVFLLKSVFQRPRPEPFSPNLKVLSASLPSAHASMSLIFYGLLVYFFLGTVRNWESRLKLVVAGSFTALLIGFSRIYLGVHWLSDVFEGFALGALWLTFLITANEMRRRYGGEFPWRPGWQPLHLSKTIRTVIFTIAALSVLGCTITYLFRNLGKM